MPHLKPNFMYEVTNTYVTNSGEGRILVNIQYIDTQEIDGAFVNTQIVVAEFNFGIGTDNPQTANVEQILYSAVPKYFTE